MYFITAVVCTIISVVLWVVFKEKKALHLDVLAIIFGAATLMWLADVLFTAFEGENPFEFEALDWWISLWTLLGGLAFWGIFALVANKVQQKKA